MTRTAAQIHVSQTVDHNDVLSEVPGRLKYQTVRDMRKHPTIRIARMMAIAPALQQSWSVRVADSVSGDLDTEVIDLVEEQVIPHKSSFLERALLGMIDFGWAPFEIIWDGFDLKRIRTLLHDITEIRINHQGDFLGFTQQYNHQDLFNNTADSADIDVPAALILNQWVEGDNLYGEADMEAAYEPWLAWRKTEQAAQRYDAKVAGASWHLSFPVGLTPYGSDGKPVDNGVIAKEIVTKLRASGDICTPNTVDRTLSQLNDGSSNDNKAWKIELIESSGQAAGGFNTRQRYLDVSMVRALVLPERSILEGQHGTLAEAETHADLAHIVSEHRMAKVFEAVNKQCVDPLVAAHFGEKFQGKVFIEASSSDDQHLAFLRKLYEKILDAPDGALVEVSEIDVDRLRDLAGVPTLPEDAEERTSIPLTGVEVVDPPNTGELPDNSTEQDN